MEASDIGRALALGLRGKGCHLALVDLNREGLAKLASELGDHGHAKMTMHIADVGDRDRMRALAPEVAEAHVGLFLCRRSGPCPFAL